MQEHLRTSDANFADHCESATQRDARLLPGPLPVADEVALEAKLHTSAGNSGLTKTRFLVGAAVVTAAVSVPDISAGAMDAPLMRFEMGETKSKLPPPVWSPSARSTGPVYASAMAAEEIAPHSLTIGRRERFFGGERMMPLAFLETGSERFDLAFAGVAMPSPAAISISAGLPDQPLGEFRAGVAPLRARLIDVPQISQTLAFAPRMQSSEQATTSVPSADTSTASALGNSRVAMANEAVEAAFAGELDVSGGASDAIRRAIPIESAAESNGSGPASVETARAVPISAPDAGIASASAEQIELVQKTELNARVNGVLTGTVQFEQRAGTIAVRLGSVVDLLRERYSSSEIDRLSGSGALGSYVTLAQLQAAGVPIRYNAAYDEVEFGIDYDDAPQAAKVQVEQIGAPTIGTDRVGIDQITTR